LECLPFFPYNIFLHNRKEKRGMKRLCAPALVLLVLLAGCGKRSANDYFSKAEGEYKAAKDAADTLHNRDERGKFFQPALQDYMKVIDEYPGDPLAERALFMTATIQNDEMRDPEKAISSYKLYADKYPDANRAPVATFLVGYLYHNDLHALDSASSWYKRFLERYPQHEMAVSAQFELSSLGKAPEDLLPADTVAVPKQGMATGSKTKKAGVRQNPM
jgi:outer membrane protein assembly factor BamD (BamD/ComL family)